jgi:lysophospholipase L1-like esterase
MGSSIISRWKLYNVFGLKRIKNNGMSGLLTNNLFKTRLNFSNPKYIIFYCGGNDLRNNISPSIIINNTNKYLEFLITKFTNTKIVLLSIFMSNKFKDIQNEISIVNKWYHDISDKYPNNIIFLNVNKKMHQTDYYDSDGIHLNHIGYNKLKNIIESSILE